MKQANTVPASSRGHGNSRGRVSYPLTVHRGGVYYRGQAHEWYLEANPAKGLGRWVYCKYCYRSHRPLITREVCRGKTYLQVVGECGYAYTPPLETIKELKAFLNDEVVPT